MPIGGGGGGGAKYGAQVAWSASSRSCKFWDRTNKGRVTSEWQFRDEILDGFVGGFRRCKKAGWTGCYLSASWRRWRTTRRPRHTVTFGIRSTPVLPQQHIKHPRHSAQSAGGRLQLNTHTPYVCGFAWSDMVHGCMVYTKRAEIAAVSCGTSHASAVSTPLRWIFKKEEKKEEAIHSCRITCERSESARERRIALYKSDQ